MTQENDSIGFDLRPLFEASKKLHGYLLHTWFKKYLDLIALSAWRWVEHGVTGRDGRPTEETDYSLLFDTDAIDIEKITYILGFYLYILASHKKANYFMMREDETKRVLYLRGFDYESAVYAGGGFAWGFSSVDTMRFNHQLAGHLRPDFEIFTALSPLDLSRETTDAQRYFHGDYDGLVRAASDPIRSVYLNANHWQEDVAWLVERMDYFIVYVSSITESVLWELDLLKRRGRTDDTTVVFDEEAIDNKTMQAGVQEGMKETYGDAVLWSKNQAGAETFTKEGLRELLTRSFLVASSEEFFGDIGRHTARIGKAHSPVGVGAREAPLPFRFFPALDAEALKRLYDFDESVETTIRQQVSSRGITNLPWFLNNVQLKILTSLMLGKHDETGRALAVYSAVMDVTRKQLFVSHASGDVLEEHFVMASYASNTLMAYGKSHEFGSYLAKANEIYDEVFASASDAVESFFSEAYRRRGG